MGKLGSGLVSARVLDGGRIKDRDVSIGPHFQAAFVLHSWRDRLQPLGWQQRHPAQRFGQARHFHLPDIFTQHFAEGASASRVRPLGVRHRVGGDDDERRGHGKLYPLRAHRVLDHDAAHFPVLLECFFRQAFARGLPLQVAVADLHRLLPSFVEDGRLNKRGTRRVRIGFRRHIDAAFPRPRNHVEHQRNRPSAGAVQVDNVDAGAAAGRIGDGFLNPLLPSAAHMAVDRHAPAGGHLVDAIELRARRPGHISRQCSDAQATLLQTLFHQVG